MALYRKFLDSWPWPVHLNLNEHANHLGILWKMCRFWFSRSGEPECLYFWEAEDHTWSIKGLVQDQKIYSLKVQVITILESAIYIVFFFFSSKSRSDCSNKRLFTDADLELYLAHRLCLPVTGLDLSNRCSPTLNVLPSSITHPSNNDDEDNS